MTGGGPAGGTGGSEGWEWRRGLGGRSGPAPCRVSWLGICLVPGLTPAQEHTLSAFAACQEPGVTLGHVFTDGSYHYGGEFSTLPRFRACMDRWEP